MFPIYVVKFPMTLDLNRDVSAIYSTYTTIKVGANGLSSICTPLYCGSDGTIIVLDQVCIISDRREHLRLIVSKDLSNLSFASLTAASWPHVQMKKLKLP
jgi:hypothetical protein